MKVFVVTKKKMIVYLCMAAALLGVYTVGGALGEAVLTGTSAAKQIPIYSVETKEPKIAITFDAAWGDEDTDELLRVLKANNARSSFFMVGGWIDRFPESTKKLAGQGHEILNHSDTHAHMSGLTKEQILKEIEGCENKILNTLGSSKKLFRAPYGEYDDNLVQVAKEAGYTTIQWDVDSLDWKDLSVEEMEKRILGKVKNGSILLFHNGAKNTPKALEVILPKLAEKGYKFVPVSELIYKENFTIDNSGKQAPQS